VAANGIIATVAGKGASGYSGDGATATNAGLNLPCGVAVDSSGNLYIADTDNERIRKVAANGIITTVAGKGAAGYSGDGGPATNASLNLPYGAALDAFGNLYIADRSNNRIRKVAANGIITTVAGNGSGTYAGDGGPATNASLDYPIGAAFDAAGNLYVADSGNNCIRKADTNGIITTVAGNGSGTYAGDGGAATNASLNYPSAAAVDASGNLYIADRSNNRIREVHFSGFPSLALANVTGANAGSYTVVVSSPYASVTSAVAALTVLLPPSIDCHRHPDALLLVVS
jgi:sugar lactone lactonase YvrE